MSRRLRLLIFLGTLLSSLASGAQPPAAKGVLVPTRVIMGAGAVACPVNPPSKPAESALSIAAPFIASAVGKVVSSGADALTRYIDDATREESSALSVVTTSSYFYQMTRNGADKWEPKAKFDCLSIVRGTLGNPDPRLLSPVASVADPTGRFRGQGNDFPALRILGLADFPEFYLELAVEHDPLNTAFRFRPQFLYVRQSHVKAEPGKRYDLNITLAFSLPGVAAPFAVAPVHFPNLLAGTLYSITEVSTDNPWVTMPRPPDAKTIPASLRGATTSISMTPFNLTATVEETSSPSKFLVFVSQLLGHSSDSLGKATESGVEGLLKQQEQRH